MGIEIERKFLLSNESWRDAVSKTQYIAQGYLANTERGSIRVRISAEQASLNIKSMTIGVTRSEYDYPLPLADAKEMLHELCMQPVIEKTRHIIPMQDYIWEIDEFHGQNAGLIVAEIELPTKDSDYPKPAWLGAEVSDDVRYYNVNLIEYPYSIWNDG